MPDADANSPSPAPDRAKTMLHPVRARILVMLHARPLTPRQIAAELEGVPLGTVYRHLNLMLAAGLIEVVGERRVHGTVERTFATVEQASYVDREQLTPDYILGLVAGLTGVVNASFDRYVRRATLPPPEGEVSFVASSLYLTPDENAELRRYLMEVLRRPARGPREGTARRLVAFFSVPEAEPEPDGDEP